MQALLLHTDLCISLLETHHMLVQFYYSGSLRQQFTVGIMQK